MVVGNVIVRIDIRFYRPAEVESLIGDPMKAHRDTGWKHTTDIDDLIKEMVLHDLQLAKKQVLTREMDSRIHDRDGRKAQD